MTKPINTILTLKDKMSQPLFKVSKNVEKVTKEMKASANQIEKWKNNSVKSIDKVVKRTGQATAAFGALAIAMGFKGLMELEEAGAKVKSIAGDSLELNNIQKELLKASTKTGVAFNELADAQYSAISSGVAANDSLASTVQVNKLAIAGFADTNDALKLMTSTMNVYGLTGIEAMTEISDKMLITQNLGVTSVQELANSMGQVTPIAKAVGLEIDDVLGTIGALTKNGQGTSEAVTGLKGALSNIINPSAKAQKMAKKLGIDFSVSALKAKGFTKFLEEIKVKAKGNTDAMGQLFGSVQGLNSMLSLTSEGGFKDFENIMDGIKDSAGKTEEAYATMTNTIGFKLGKMKNTAKNTFTAIMQSQAGLIGEYADKLNDWVENNEEKIQDWIDKVGQTIDKAVNFAKAMSNFVAEHQTAIMVIGTFVGGLYVAFKVIAIVKTAIGALTTVGMIFSGTLAMTPLGAFALALGGIAAVAMLVYRNWDKMLQKGREIKEFMANPIKNAIQATKDGPSTRQANSKLKGFSKGTSYSPAGFARIHEEGGEIRRLSSGETIIPADKSDRILKGQSTGGPSVNVQIYGNIYGDDDIADKVGNTVFTRVKLALDNV